MTDSGVVVRPITQADADAVGTFLQTNLNGQVTAESWSKLIRTPWPPTGPNHGFQLVTSAGDIVGVYAAVYSRRQAGDEIVELCNLAAFCVLENHRLHSLKLVRALLAQTGFVFTDLSPSGNVIAMNERFGFERLDTETRLVINLPHPIRRGTRLTNDPATLAGVLTGRDAEIYRDHRDAAAVNHLLIERDGAYGYLMFRRDRRKGLKLFATPLFAGGDRALVEASWGAVSSYLLRRGLPLMLAERRVLGFAHGGIELAHPRPKMVRGNVAAMEIDYLYSELTLVAW